MIKFTNKLLSLLFVFITCVKLNAQMSGAYSLPGSFPTLAAAISSLNSVGVNGPVSIDIAANYTETAPAGGYSLTATGTLINPIVFQKSGLGANPLITAFTGSNTPSSATQDGVFHLIGSDYITFNGLSIVDLNTTNPQTMEYGIGFFKAGTANGCQNNTIQNCVITLNRINNAAGIAPATDGSRGINVVNSLINAQTSVLAATSVLGSNSNNHFYSNIIQNCNIGIALTGFTDVSPFSFADTGNDIGGSSIATGNTIVNFGGGAGATNPAAAVRTLSQYNINVAYNAINNNNGSGVNHLSTLRGIYLNTATSANVSVNNNTLTLGISSSALQVSAIENVSGSTAAGNTITINYNRIQNCNNSSNTTGSFFGIYNNGASPSYLDISNNTFVNIATSATNGNNYLIYNTGSVASGISITNNLITNCTNAASGSGAYYNLFNNAVSTASLSISSNTISNSSSSASAGATHLIYNSSNISGNISIINNLIAGCTHSVNSSGAIYGLFNNGASLASLDMSGNVFTSWMTTNSTGNIHLVYNTAPITNSITMSNNVVSACTNSLTSTGSYFAIYNNAAAAASLDMSNNTFTNIISSATTGSVQLIYNRGTVANVFTNINLVNNLISSSTFSASSTSNFLGIYNSGVTASNLNIAGNTISASSWLSATSSRYLIYNSGVVTNSINLNNNLISNCTSTLNTTGIFYGVYNTANTPGTLSMCNNTFLTLSSSATSGASNLLYNSGAVTTVITITNNLVSNINFAATTSGDFYGIFNTGNTALNLDISSNTFTNNVLKASSGVTNLIYNAGAAVSTINAINMNYNVIANCTNSISSTGSYFAIYNNAASAASLSMSNNTFTNNTSALGTGATHLIYNRGVATNTFNAVLISNNIVSNYTNTATGNGSFYNIYNNGLSSGSLSIISNTIVNEIWNTSTSPRYLVANTGTVTNGISLTNNLFSNLTNSLNTTGAFFGVYTSGNSAGTLNMSNNTFTNNLLSATTGTTYLLFNSGNMPSGLAITNNVIANYTNSATTTADFYGIANSGTSSSTVNLSGNTFTNNNLYTSTGSSYLVYNAGLIVSNITGINMSNNFIANNTNSISSSGSFFGIYNNAASCGNLVMSNNTYTNNANYAANGAVHLVYNRGAFTNTFTTISISNNLIANHTNSATAAANFYSIYNNGVSCGNLSIVTNTFTNDSWLSSSSPRFLIANTGSVSTNGISITNNLFSNLTNSLNTTGAFYGIYNAGAANSDLIVTNNTFTNNSFASTAGATNLIYNSGIITTTVLMNTNLVANCTSSSTGAGDFYGIFNTGSSTYSVGLTNNTFTNNAIVSSSGATNLIYNSGAVLTTINTINMSNNLVANCSNSITSTGSYFAIYNNGVSAANLNMTNNTFTNCTSTSATGATHLIYNRGALTNTFTTVLMTSNLISNYSNFATSNGIFYSIFNNGVTAANLDMSSNTFTNDVWSTSTSNRYLINNTGVVTVSASIVNNFVSNLTNTLNTTGSFYGINNAAAATSSAVLNISNNTFTNNALAGTSGAVQIITSTGIINNTIAITDNLIANYTSSLSSTGLFYVIYNASSSNANLSLTTNTIVNCVSSTSTGVTYLIYNTAAIVNSITVVNNLISNFTNSTTSGAFAGIYNTGASGNLDMSSNTFTNIPFYTTASNRFMLYNTGSMSVSASFINNVIANLTNTLNTIGSFYGLNNSPGGTSTGLLTINNNIFTNNQLAGTTGAVQVITLSGTINNTISITNNLISNYTSSLSTTGLFYGIYSNSASNANLSLTTNSIINCVSSTSTGVTYLIYNTGAILNGIRATNNLVSSFTNSSTTGNFAGIYNAGASASLDMSSNTFTNIPFYTSASNRLMLYNTGVIGLSNTFTNNIVANLTASLNTTGIFYGLYNGAGAVSSASLFINNNTFTNNSLSATTGGAQIITSAGTINNTITITNNLISNYTSSITGNGSYYGIYNASASNANLNVSNNLLTNNISGLGTGSTFLFYNTGAVTNSISIINNSIANFTNNASGAGGFYGIYNNAASSGNLDISSNTFTNNFSSTTNGPTHFVYNRGSATNTFNIVTLNNNLISNCTQSASTNGNIFGVFNSGVLAGNLSVLSNTVVNNVWATLTSNRYLIYNTGQVTNTIVIDNNLFSNLTNTTNTTGIFYGILNSSPASGNLQISNNTLNNNFSAATTGNMHLIYNSGIITNTIAITNNMLANCTHSALTSAPFYGIYNNATSYAGLDISNNTFTNCAATSSTGTSYVIYNLGLTSNTITNIAITNNLISNFTHTAFTGPFYGILNNNVTSGNLSVLSNSFTNIVLTTSTSARYFVYNTGTTSISNNLNNNIVSNCTSTMNTTGNFYGIYNAAASPGFLSMSGNSFNNNSYVSTTGISYVISNTGAITNSTSILNNVIASTTHSSSTNGTFYGIYNVGVTSNAININNNTLNNDAVSTTSITPYFIYNNGTAVNTTSALSISNNTFANCSASISLNAPLYLIFNNLLSSTNLNINGNTISNQNIVTTNSARYLVYNTGSVSTSASINNNFVVNGNFINNTTAALYGIYNTANCLGGLTMSSNTFSNSIAASSTGTTYLLYNTGASSNTIAINNNLISGISNTATSSGAFYGIYNNGSTSIGLDMSGNTFSNTSVFTNSTSNYFIYSAGSPTILINTISLNNNSINTSTFSTGSTASFYGIFNNGIPSQNLNMSGNSFGANVLTTTTGTPYLIYNTGPSSNAINIDNNQLSTNSIFTGTTNPFYGIYNAGVSSSSLSISSNSITTNFLNIATGDTYLVYNTAAVTNTINANNNLISSNSNSVATSGNFYGLFNLGISKVLNLSGNNFSNNNSQIITGNTSLIYNAAAVTDIINCSNNNLDYTFNNGTLAYTGVLNGIFNNSGSTTTTLNIDGNNFSNIGFPNLTGLGPIYFISNTNDNSSLSFSNNTWTNLSIKNSGAHYLMNNASNTQSSISVTNNSIVTGYNRTAAAGLLYGYYTTGANLPAANTQTFSGNNFSNITGTVSGIGNFYGLYCNDGGVSPFPRKTIFNNVISNVNYNSSSDFIGIYTDYLGDGSSGTASSVYSNTVSNISWRGSVFALYNGLNASPNLATNIYSNSINNLFSSGPISIIYPVSLSGGGSGLNFYKNKINDISESGSSGIAYGLYVIGASNTNIHNNIIGNINAPTSSAADAVNGIYINAGSVLNLYYNTVYLNASSSGANFNSNALYAATNPTLNLRNNIFINNSIASGSGITAVYRRSLPILGTYSASSNNNLFYAGIPTASNVIFHDGTTSYPTIASFQALVTPRDNNSVTENTPFSSTIGLSPNYLHVDPLLPSLTESGAVNITGIIDDFDGQIRQGNAGYAGGGSAPDIGADEYDQNLPPCSSANAGTISPVSIVRCAGQTVAMNSAGYTYTAAGGIVHQWKVSATPGGPYTNVIGSANSAVYSSNTLTSGVQYYVLSTTCTNNAQVSISNEATITINPVPTVSVSISSPTVCAGQTVLLGGSTDIGTNFLWNGPNSYTSALQSTTISNANTMSSGAYSLIVSVGSCTSVNSTFITVNPTPPAFSLTPLSSAVCAGASQTLTASAIISTPTLNFSSQINQNPAAGYPAPYSVYYGGQKMQFLVLGTELSAAGFIGGSPITSLEFPVISLGANWGVSIGECQNFEMKIGHTALTSLTSFQTGLSSVVSPSNFTPVVGGNVHNFSAPFVWDGTSNIILESSFSNNLIGNGGYSVIQYNSPTGFLSTIVYRADNQTAGAIAAATNPNINIGVARPNFVLNGVPVGTYSWSPAIGLSSTNTQSTVATPTGSTIYTIELANGLCTSQSTVSMNVVQMPTVSIATTSSLICVGNPATLTASGANTYTWSTGSTNTNITVSPSGSINYSLMGMNAPCPSATAIITISVSPALTITALASSPAVCSGQSATLSANGAPSYTWSTGANTSTIVVTPTVNTSYTVTGSSGPGCIAKKVVAIVSNSLPILVVTPSSQTVCAGELVSFSAAGANTYIWLPDNLSSQLFTALPPITTSYTLVGQAANNCKDSVMVTAVVDPCTSIGKTTSLNNFMRVFPNPSTGFITAQFEFEGEKEIHVINSLGATIIQLISDKDLETFDLSAFTKGIYFVRVSTKDGSANYKIIIE